MMDRVGTYVRIRSSGVVAIGRVTRKLEDDWIVQWRQPSSIFGCWDSEVRLNAKQLANLEQASEKEYFLYNLKFGRQ
jgi:hypothetical protein